MDDPHFSFFSSSLSLPLSCFDQGDLIDKHTHAFKKKKRETIVMTISSVRNACVSCVTTIGLSYVLSHLFKVDLLYYMSRGRQKRKWNRKGH